MDKEKPAPNRPSPSRNENVDPADDPCCCCEPEPRWQELADELGLAGKERNTSGR